MRRMSWASDATPSTVKDCYQELPTVGRHPVVPQSQCRLGFRWCGQVADEDELTNRKRPDDERDGGAGLRADRAPEVAMIASTSR
jgi:hypothetical protein